MYYITFAVNDYTSGRENFDSYFEALDFVETMDIDTLEETNVGGNYEKYRPIYEIQYCDDCGDEVKKKLFDDKEKVDEFMYKVFEIVETNF